MCPRPLEEAFNRALRGEEEVDEHLCAHRPHSTQSRGVPADSPLAPAMNAVEQGLEGDGSVLVTPPYHIVRKWPSKKRRAKQRKTTRPITPVYKAPHVEERALPYHPPVDDRTGDSGIDRSLPNGDRD